MTSSPTTLKKMSPVQKVDLPKIDKLLDKLQRNISKCQDDDYYEESEKYVSHIEKTSELCSLVWQELIGTLEMSVSNQCIKTLDKLFKVMRLQSMSTLNFGLHYYKQYSEALLDREKNDSLSPKTRDTIDDLDKQSPGKPQGTFESRLQVNETFDNLEGRGSVMSTSPANRRQPYHRGGPNYPVFTVNGHVPAGKTVTRAPVLSSQAKSLTNFKYTFGAQLNKTDRDFSPEMLAASDNRHNQLNSMQEMLENMPTEEQEQNMLKEYYDEHDKMQQQIDEVLKGKTKVASLTPNNVTINLRQVLRNLDSTQKQITQITDTKNNTFDDDDSDDLEEPNFGEMATKIKNAFLQAKLKAASNIKGVLKSTSNSPALKKKAEPVGKGGKSIHSKNKASKGGAAADQVLIVKKDASTNVDELEFIMEEQQAMLGNENNKNQQKAGGDEKEEKNKLLINSLKIKIGQLEKEKSDKSDKYTKLVNDYAQCAQEKRDAWEKIKQLEKEIEELKALLKQKSLAAASDHHHHHQAQNIPMTIAEARIPIAQTHDHSERSPVTALQFNNLSHDSRGELYTTKNQEWDNVRGASEIFSNSAKHEAHGDLSSHHGTSNPPSVRHIGAGSNSSGGADNIKSLQEVTSHHPEKNSSSSPQKVVKGRIPSKSLHSSTVKSNFKQYQSNHESPINEHPDYLEAPPITEIANSNESNISENQKRSLERMINEPSFKLEDLQEEFSADVDVPRRSDYVKGDTDNNESQQTLSIEERPEYTEIIHPEKSSVAAPIFIQSKEENKEELVDAIRDSTSLVAIKAQGSDEIMENNSAVSLGPGPGPKSLSQSRLQTPSHITSPTQARKRIDVIVKTEVGDRSKRVSPDKKTNNIHSERSPKNHENKKGLSINNFEKAHVRPSNQRSSKLVLPAAATQTKMATIFSTNTEKSQVSEIINPGMYSVDEESNATRAQKFMSEIESPEPRLKREHRREKSLADYTPNKLSILQSSDFQEDVPMNKVESPSKGRALVKRNIESQHSRPARITTQQPSRITKPPRESGMKSPQENHRSPTANLRRALEEEEDNSVSYTSPNLPNLNNSNESTSNNNYHHSTVRNNVTNNVNNTRTLGKSSTLVYLRTADSPTHQNRPKPGIILQSNSSLVNLHSISKTNIKSPTYMQEFVQSKTPSIAKKIWQEVEEVKNFPANGILYKGRSKFPTAVPMTYDSAEDRGHAESSPNRYMYSTSRGLEDEVIGNNTDPRSFPITISNYSPKSSHLQLNDFSSGFNTTSDKFVKPKLTIEECLRLEVNKEKEAPAHNREDGQVRIMYRSMLAKAKQDPKLIQYIRRLVEIEGQDLSASEHPIVEFSAFARFVKKYADFHEKCGEHCEHIVKFYAKIGYQVFWNKRAPMPIKRAEIGVRANDTGRNSPRFPSIGKKKKELGKDIYH